MLAKFKTQKVAFIDMTSASGDMLPVVSAPNRVVITATKSSFERNESHFAQFFVDALTKDVADVDKDGRVSLLEAFLLDFEDDLYGRRVVVELWDRLRDEAVFESEAELIAQIAHDVEQTRRATRPAA
jgi:hypothetical protein